MNTMRIPLHVQVVLSMLLSVVSAYIFIVAGWDAGFVLRYTQHISSLFLNSLKLTIVPLVICSLIVSINGTKELKSLSRIGILTVLLYTVTTLFAVSLGIGIGNLLQPGKLFSANIRELLISQYRSSGNMVDPGSGLSRLLPDNLIQLISHNGYLLQIVCISILIGVVLMRMEEKKRKPFVDLCESVRDMFIGLMNLLVLVSPIAIFTIVFSQLLYMGQQGGTQNIWYFLRGLMPYTGGVVAGLAMMVLFVYPLLLKLFSKVGWVPFLRHMYPAQMIAFSTASSTATLRISSEQVMKLGVSERITNFVMPIGAVINVDGTALYQGIAIMFITQAFGKDLSLSTQIWIICYVTISSVGLGGTPGGSLVTTSLLLDKLGIPLASGIALIYLPDRILDMCRSATNITGDAAVAILVDRWDKRKKKKRAKRA